MGYMYLGVFAVVLFYSNAASGYESLLTPCKMNDANCLRESCTAFLRNSAKGVGQPYNIAQYDPMDLPPLDLNGCCDDTSKVQLKNIKVAGLKDTILENFVMSPEEKIARFNATAIYKVTADITFDLANKSKTFSGSLETTMKTLVHTEYPFGLDRHEDGSLHLVIRPETITCVPKETPIINYSAEMKEAMDKDPDVKMIRETQMEKVVEANRRFACKISDMVFPALVDAFRKASKVMSMTDYFTDFKEE